MKRKPKPRQFTNRQLVVLWTVWALNIGGAFAFAYYFPEQFRALRELDSRRRGLIFLIVPSIITTFFIVWNSFRGPKRQN